MMDDSVQPKSSKCGDKRKAPSGTEKPQKKPWGTDGPPPAEWIEVCFLNMNQLSVDDEKKEDGSDW